MPIDGIKAKVKWVGCEVGCEVGVETAVSETQFGQFTLGPMKPNYGRGSEHEGSSTKLDKGPLFHATSITRNFCHIHHDASGDGTGLATSLVTEELGFDFTPILITVKLKATCLNPKEYVKRRNF
ncbi:hypothetical protein VNO80_13468 [Phaseolus coccineus]|uniref:Uncharacterized protein n=1 Tax=Phaseolus coccineus TaxID=3886 RepID=A0AAN9R9Y6_PHACN